MALWLLAYLPVVGLLAWRANKGSDGEKVAFFINLALLWLSAFWFFGYPGLIIGALIATGTILLTLVTLTGTSLFSKEEEG